MNKWIWLLVAPVFSGCAVLDSKSYTEPMYGSLEQEQEECLQRAWCRTFLDDRPAWVFRYSSWKDNCAAYSKDIVEQARKEGKTAYYVVGDIGPDRHAVAVVEGSTGDRWAFDNGRISNSPFPAKELSHWMKNRSYTNELPPNPYTDTRKSNMPRYYDDSAVL